MTGFDWAHLIIAVVGVQLLVVNFCLRRVLESGVLLCLNTAAILINVLAIALVLA